MPCRPAAVKHGRQIHQTDPVGIGQRETAGGEHPTGIAERGRPQQ